MENTTNPSNIITIADMDLCKRIIDLASSRGAFQGAELKTVGEVYEKLSLFLDVVAAQAKEREERSQTDTSESSNTDSDQPQGE